MMATNQMKRHLIVLIALENANFQPRPLITVSVLRNTTWALLFFAGIIRTHWMRACVFSLSLSLFTFAFCHLLNVNLA